MESIFIEHIHINKVRHLTDIDIPLSSDERKHLILTGKNESGKTSVLQAIRNHISILEMNRISYENLIKLLSEIEFHEQEYERVQAKLKMKDQLSEDEYNKTFAQFQMHDMGKYYSRKQLNMMHTGIDSDDYLILSLKNINLILEYFTAGNMVFAFFNAKRDNQLNKPKGISKIELKGAYSIHETARTDFIQLGLFQKMITT